MSTTAVTQKLPVSVVILTFNEESNLERCLQSVHAHAGEILVVDSFSTDGTLDIARRYTEKIHQHPYEGHPQQWQWTLSHVPFGHDWVLAVDADFSVTPALWHAIGEALHGNDAGINGYFVRHRQVFRGRFLRHGTLYPRYWLRLFRHRAVRVDLDELVDVHFYVQPPVGRLEHDVIEDNVKDRDLAFWIGKQLRFAERQAAEELRGRGAAGTGPTVPRLLGSPDQRVLWLKQVWRRLPRYLRPFLLFGYRYVIRLGFLDGKEGFLYHFTQALLYRLAVDVRVEELEAGAVDTQRSAKNADRADVLSEGKRSSSCVR